MKKFVGIIYGYGLQLAAVASIVVLFMISSFSVCYISSDQYERTYFCTDRIWINLIFFVALLVVALFLSNSKLSGLLKEKLKNSVLASQVKYLLLGIIFIEAILWTSMTQYTPASDQLDVISSAYKLRQGDYGMLDVGGYIYRCTNQLGLMLIEYAAGTLFGDYNATLFQVLNVFGVTLVYKKV